MQLLVGRAGRAQRELLHAVAGKAGVRVAVDEPGDRAEPASVDLVHLAVETRKVAHAADALDRSARAEDVRVFDHVDLGELASPQRGSRPCRCRELFQIADEQAAPAARGIHPRSAGGIGASSPCDSAAAIASG